MNSILSSFATIFLCCSGLEGSTDRFRIDLDARASIIKKLKAGEIEYYGRPEIQLYGISDFYPLLDKVLKFSNKDDAKILQEISLTISNSGKTPNLEDLLAKKSEYLASVNLIHYFTAKNEPEKLKEFVLFFDKLILLALDENKTISIPALEIIRAYHPNPQAKADPDFQLQASPEWLIKNFYTDTEIGKKLSHSKKLLNQPNE